MELRYKYLRSSSVCKTSARRPTLRENHHLPRSVGLRADVLLSFQSEIMANFHIYHGNLPHWRQSGVTYWVAWNLCPEIGLLEPEERTLVQTALEFFSGQRYELSAYVIMDNHVHLLVYPFENHTLESLVHSWKSFTASQLQKRFGRRNAIWQRESYDHIIRSEVDYQEKLRYMMRNPFDRWPEIESYQWMFPQLG